MGLFTKKYKIVFLRKHFNALFVQTVIERNELKEVITLVNKKFTIDIQNPCYIAKDQKIYFVDYDSGSKLTFTETKSLMNPNDLDLIIGQQIIKELTSGVMDNKKEKMGLILLGVLLGALIAAVVAMGYYNSKIEEILTETTDNVIVISNYIKFGKGVLQFWNK